MQADRSANESAAWPPAEPGMGRDSAREPQRRRAPVASLPGRRTVKKEWQAAWLLKAVTCIDLTTLAGDDTPGRVRRLCAKARQPVRQDLLEALGVGDLGLTVPARSASITTWSRRR